MKLSYNKLWKLLIDKGMTKTEMRLKADISTTTLAKLGKNETVSMEVLLKICKVLECNVGDIMDVIIEEVEDSYKDKRLIPALKQAEASGIKIAYSNIAFEVWLISHFEKCKTTLQLDGYISELDKLLKENGSNKTYSKADEKLLKECFITNYKKAIENSKIIYQNYVKIHNAKYPNQRQPIWNWVSSTTVYKLVEALKLKD